ncbi:hypothetical protein ZHAS_00016613 [Anopheles sinensis]|uniref:Uncharacterized protein n=1 Tax=Anopheles sinensis TaxID=74873 RepID=A0A084WEH9_ANOSI|nr:hypothetical protein ZHAS_00016613 [Anopheles sinensis]
MSNHPMTAIRTQPHKESRAESSVRKCEERKKIDDLRSSDSAIVEVSRCADVEVHASLLDRVGETYSHSHSFD